MQGRNTSATGANTMCNIAGYVGTEPAAPILLDMLEREEGLAGGYYTGVATIHDGVLHYRKVVGDTARLRAVTDAEDLPGNIGLAHSRSNSGGDHEWSHPFIGCDDRLAYIANGSTGKWKDDPRLQEGAQRFADAGHQYRAVHKGQIGGYPMLDDGRCVHISDVMAHGIGDALDRLGDPEQAIREAFLDMPSEIVGMFISRADPDRIFGARWNLPACVARDGAGTYIASAPQAFPGEPAWWTWVPPSSVFSVTADRLCLSPLAPADEAIADDIDRAHAREAVLAALADGPKTFGELAGLSTDLSQRDELIVACDPIYEVLWDLEREGRIVRDIEQVAGAKEGLTAPRFVHRLATNGQTDARESSA